MNFCKYLLKDKNKLTKKVFVDKEITYSQLLKDIEIVTTNLKSNERKIIGISFENSYEFIIYYLSIINSNNIALIIEKGLPIKKYNELLDKYEISLFFTDLKLNLGALSNQYEISSDILKKSNCVKLTKKNKIDKINNKYFKDVSLILFTSGSTGEKKGVMLTNSNLISNTKSILKVLPVKRTDVVNLVLPLSYSFGLSVLNTHLKVGSSFFFHNSPFVGSVTKEIKDKKCTCFYGVPSTYKILMDKTNFINENLKQIKFLAQAGGELSSVYKKKLQQNLKINFLYVWGYRSVSPIILFKCKISLKKIKSIGKPLDGVKFKLFKTNSSEHRELGVSGKNIMKGYLFEEKLTQSSFKKKYYLTGDLATRDKEGFYYIIKRKDKVLKRFGFKIQISFIENKINNLDFVVKSKIKLFKDNKMTLKVYVKKNSFHLKKKINEFLRSNFASYEIPNEIIIEKFNNQILELKN